MSLSGDRGDPPVTRFVQQSRLDTIGIGTNLYDLHSARESMDHTSAARVWPLIKDVMRHLDH